MTPRILVAGDVMVDVVAVASVPLARGSDAPATVRSHGGGSAANVAAWLAATGVPVGLFARVGADAAGSEAIAELREAGVEIDAVVDAERPTGTCVVVVEPGGERTFLPDRGANLALDAGDLPAGALRAGDHLHLSGYTLLDPGPGRQAGLELLARARAVGASVSVDPASSAPLRAVGAAAFLEWVAGADALLPNADEARVLTGESDPALAARALARRTAAEVVVTSGAGGAVWSDGESVVHEPARAHVAVRDTTGAGDAWTAGWLGARLAGAGVPEALRAGAALGARAVAQPGARPP